LQQYKSTCQPVYIFTTSLAASQAAKQPSSSLAAAKQQQPSSSQAAAAKQHQPSS